jgi:hypothetical protein
MPSVLNAVRLSTPGFNAVAIGGDFNVLSAEVTLLFRSKRKKNLSFSLRGIARIEVSQKERRQNGV